MRHLKTGTGSGPSPVPVPGAILCIAICLIALSGHPALAQHLGSRLQWQPETMQADPRLDQPVEIEIIGRAAVPALELLSQATGVSLGVAPEDLNTVGERKLTIISKGLTLKAIMAQVPEALQEAHWDIDMNGEEPAYLLHRNAGVDQEAERQDRQRWATFQEDRKQQTRESLADARRALAMSPEELDELEQTDIFLARAAKYPPTRALIEAYVSLPDDKLNELIETAALHIPYTEAPPALREAVRVIFELQRDYLQWARTQGGPFSDGWLTQLDEVQKRIGDSADAAIRIRDYGREVGPGSFLSIESDQGSAGVMLVPARFSLFQWPGSPYEWLLVRTGETPDAARSMVKKSGEDWPKLVEARLWAEAGWTEPTDPRLHEVVDWPVDDEGFVRLSGAQQRISDRTGLSIISDWFTYDAIPQYPGQPALGGPLWHDLYVLGKLGQYKWVQAGDCLVFHRTDWHLRAQRELPESLIAEYKARLARQGHFTLEDIAELASVLALRPLPRPGGFSMPLELHDTGACVAACPNSRWPLLLWRALSPDERAAGESEQGLRFADLPGRSAAALARAAWPVAQPVDHGQTPDDRIRGGIFTVRRSEGSDEQGSYAQYDLGIEYPDDPREAITATVMLHEVKPRPADEAATEEAVR